MGNKAAGLISVDFTVCWFRDGRVTKVGAIIGRTGLNGIMLSLVAIGMESLVNLGGGEQDHWCCWGGGLRLLSGVLVLARLVKVTLDHCKQRNTGDISYRGALG
jgi:hypothetical protein